MCKHILGKEGNQKCEQSEERQMGKSRAKDTVVDADLIDPSISFIALAFGDVVESTDVLAVVGISAGSSDSLQVSWSVGLSWDDVDFNVSASVLDSNGCRPIPFPKNGVNSGDNGTSAWKSGWNSAFHGAGNVVFVWGPVV
jgi:hypothetical protein